MKNTILYAETIAVLAAVALVVHVLASVDWPWAIAAGAAAAVLLRALLPDRSATQATEPRRETRPRGS